MEFRPSQNKRWNHEIVLCIKNSNLPPSTRDILSVENVDDITIRLTFEGRANTSYSNQVFVVKCVMSSGYPFREPMMYSEEGPLSKLCGTNGRLCIYAPPGSSYDLLGRRFHEYEEYSPQCHLVDIVQRIKYLLTPEGSKEAEAVCPTQGG